MRKTGYNRWQTLVLVGCALALGLGLLIQGVEFVLAWVAPDVQATSSIHHGQPSLCTSTQRGPVFGGSLTFDQQEVACGDLVIFGGTLDVQGQMRGNVLAFGSNINIAGNMYGDVNLYGGDVTLLNSSHLYGNINVFGGSEQTEVGAQLDGAVNHRSEHVSLWLPGLGGGFVFPFWSIVTWVVLGLALTSWLPEHLMFIRATVANKTRRSLFLGLLSCLLSPVVLIVLIALILPIPLAILIAIGLIVGWALGTIAIGWLVGEYIMRAIAPRHNTRLAQVAVGLTILILVGSLPYLGWLVSIGAGLLG
ncbi:MAG: hypothetical protein ACRDHZ_15140, partial [Ktedonobacteraceae bacterium]